jgi:hypothetical protein
VPYLGADRWPESFSRVRIPVLASDTPQTKKNPLAGSLVEGEQGASGLDGLTAGYPIQLPYSFPSTPTV